MDPSTLQQALDNVFDQALVYHGFTDYLRDYEAVVQMSAVYRHYLFRHCVQATCQTTVPPQVWRDSLDDRLIEYPSGDDVDGYVWGVRWHALYPGASLVADSATATRWTLELGIEFHEVRIQTNAHDLTLVFADLKVSDIPEGYVPFRVQP